MKKCLSIIAAIIISVPVSAEIQTYSDEYVSFQYDDEISGFIERYCLRTGFVSYVFIDENDAVTEISMTKDSADLEKLKEVPTNIVISDNVIIRQYNNGEKSNFFDLVKDSVSVPDDLDIPDDLDSMYIYRNYPYSEQALNYAQAGLDICNEYLTFEITGKEAEKRMEELTKRADSYSDSTGNYGDEDVYHTLSYTSLDFARNDDADIVSLKNELEMILANK